MNLLTITFYLPIILFAFYLMFYGISVFDVLLEKEALSVKESDMVLVNVEGKARWADLVHLYLVQLFVPIDLPKFCIGRKEQVKERLDAVIMQC